MYCMEGGLTCWSYEESCFDLPGLFKKTLPNLSDMNLLVQCFYKLLVLPYSLNIVSV